MIELLGNDIYLDEDSVIKEFYTGVGNIKILFHKNAIQSVTFVSKEKRNQLCDQYFVFYDLPVMLNSLGKHYLVLGGGGFTYPKYYISTYLDKNMDVVEINENCVEWAKKYFYLDELIEQYDNNNSRLNIIVDDAIKYISVCEKKYDYILIDLFDGLLPVDDIYMDDKIHNLKRILNENGIIAINYVISKGNKYKYKDVLKKIVKITKHHRLISHKYYYDQETNFGNILILLSNNEIILPDKLFFLDIGDIIY